MNKNSKGNDKEYGRNHVQKRDQYYYPSAVRGYGRTIHVGETHLVWNGEAMVEETITEETINELNELDRQEYLGDKHYIGRKKKLQESIQNEESIHCGKKGSDNTIIPNRPIGNNSPEEIILQQEEQKEKTPDRIKLNQAVSLCVRQTVPQGREHEMLLCWCEGISLREIAKKYGVGKSTVYRHIDNYCKKIKAELLKQYSESEIRNIMKSYHRTAA